MSYWVVTDDVLTVSIARQIGLWPRGLQAGNADLVIDNASGIYSPLNRSVHLGMFRPGAGIEILATCQDPVTSAVSSYFLFRGQVDTIDVQPALGEGRQVTVSARDYTKTMLNQEVSSSLMVDVPVNSAIASVFWSVYGAPHYIDPIDDILPFVWWQKETISSILDEMITGGGYAVYLATDSTIHVRDRRFELGGPVVASFAAMAGLTFSLNDADLVNRVVVQGSPRVQANSVQPVARLDEVVKIPASRSVTFWLDFEDARGEAAPAVNLIPPVAGTDYQIVSVASGTNRNSTSSVSCTFFGQAAKVTIFNGWGGKVKVSKLQIRGDPIIRQPQISVQLDQSSSQSAYGLHSTTIESDLFADLDLQTKRATDVLDMFAEPSPKVMMRLINEVPLVLGLELGDVISVYDRHSGIGDQYTVLGIAHTIDATAGLMVATDLELQQARGAGAFALDVGVLDVDRLSR